MKGKFLKNYTSNVPVSQTINRIEQVLIRCGVRGIMKDYGIDGKVVAITFKLEEDGKSFGIRLPADEKAATEALWLDYIGDDLLPDGKIKWSSRKRLAKKHFAEQGARTAWKIVQDWIEVQMSLVQTGQAKMMQVFLSYWHDGKRTYFEAVRESGYAGLLTNDSTNNDRK